ncbi:MAG: type II toxin-antitoxin system RelE/ParE family toxin [Defluviitaleaceae bacterium]|nr:type II toxin-antitoxin system RelE/ParE family toxin [Defluviitaleaceae bacterium]
MFEVHFYEDNQGKQPIKELLIELRDKSHNSKDARIQYQKILSYIRSLEEYGTRVGEPIMKHIEGDIWELRPVSHRIFFFYWQDNKFILLHHFVKKTNKTPLKEIKKARQNMNDFIERKRAYEN